MPDDIFPSILPEDQEPMPEAPVAVTLSPRTWNVVLSALMWYGKRLHRRGESSITPDFVGLRRTAEAAAAVGDAIDAPEHRRFQFEELTRND